MEIITNMLTRACLRVYISRLLISMMIAGSLSLQSSAEEGFVFPDSARVSFAWQIDFDTVTVIIENLSQDPLTQFFISDHTDSEAVFIDCRIDGIEVDSLPTDLEFGTVYPDKFTTRWIIDDFSQSLLLRYYSESYSGFKMNWSAGHPYPIFGILPGIGPPVGPWWWE